VTRVRGRHPAAQLRATIDLVRHVLAQTRARVLRDETHYPGKVVSLFEPHTGIIRKGKAQGEGRISALKRCQWPGATEDQQIIGDDPQTDQRCMPLSPRYRQPAQSIERLETPNRRSSRNGWQGIQKCALGP
jgi:hypothetical protein